MQNWLKLGDYNAVCDSCGRKFKASTMRKRWDGLFVCKEDYEYKHPQLSLKVRGDKQQVPIPRPEPLADTFIGSVCTLVSIQGVADSGTADCAQTDRVFSSSFIAANYFPDYSNQLHSKFIAGVAIAGVSVAGGVLSSLSPNV